MSVSLSRFALVAALALSGAAFAQEPPVEEVLVTSSEVTIYKVKEPKGSVLQVFRSDEINRPRRAARQFARALEGEQIIVTVVAVDGKAVTKTRERESDIGREAREARQAEKKAERKAERQAERDE
jgi:hypothetical protein